MPYDFERTPAFQQMPPAEQADLAIAEYIQRASGTRTGGLAVSTILQYLKALEWWWTMTPGHDLLGMSADAYQVFWARYTTRTKTTDGRRTGTPTRRAKDAAFLSHTLAARRKLLNQPDPIGPSGADMNRRGSYKAPTAQSAATKALRALAIRHFLEWWYAGRAVEGTLPWKGVVMVTPDKASSKRAIQKKSLQPDTISLILETTAERLSYAPPSARGEFLVESIWIAMMYGMGLRLHEPLTIPNARPSRVEIDSDEIHQVEVVRKGGHHMRMTVPDDLLPLIAAWIEVRPVAKSVQATESLLIHPRTGKPFSVRWMSRRIKEVVEAAIARNPTLPDFENCTFLEDAVDLDGERYRRRVIQVSSHWLRHSIITHLIEDGHSLPEVAEIANHADVQTTMIYLDAIKDRAPHTLKRIRLTPEGRALHATAHAAAPPAHATP